MTRRTNRNPPKPTWTSLVMEYLQKADDFMTTDSIRKAVGGDFNQINAALSHLRKNRAVDFMVDRNVTYWFATPGEDQRSKTLDQRRPEDPGTRRTRRTRKVDQ